MRNTKPEDIEALLNLVESSSEEIIKKDPFFEAKNLVQKAMRDGLIRKKTENEIHNELLRKPWQRINRIIEQNENRNDNTTDPSNHSD